MKKIIQIIVLIVSLQLNAQIITPVEQKVVFTRNGNAQNHYFKDVNGVLNNFLGNWKYETAIDKVEISIYKEESVSNSDYFEDEIYIEFKYTKNGNIIFDTFSPVKSYLIFGEGFWITDNLNKYHLRYLEPNQDKFGVHQWVDIEFIPVSGGQPQLNWITTYEAMDSYTATPPEMPMSMVFTKQP